ncbi:regulator of G-protein signaling protein-like isoform X1 [Phasianus colchicus]|uniref:regulator of G-protein signaling protein-like isoform X1 n=1 Tax=Phasianus colchicus TaxID=9054 RepID=UPI00129D6E62|nr:regulator of G-protein signaling protein-like isoform X1 [Phasianus colchicus]
MAQPCLDAGGHFQGLPTSAATIASTDIELLLRDEVFVDFFNTFLNLPVFGQTPIYSSSTGQWDLWPELPSHLDPSPPALLAWLGKHRLPHFCKSSLCLLLVLCQKLLGFIRSEEAARLLNWQSADQWLLEKCISGSQGMWRFRAFTQGMAGEELTDFWLITERLLGLDESDAMQKDLYLSLVQRLKVTHLREGSSVLTLCGTTARSSRTHVESVGTRREILSKMQQRALFILQSYWLPKFFIQCKMNMEEKKSCWPLLQEYRERLAQGHLQEPSGISDGVSPMRINRSQDSPEPYCSRKAKEKIWALIKEGRDTQEMKMQPERQAEPAGTTKRLQQGKGSLGRIRQQPERPANTAMGSQGGAKRPKPKEKQVLQLEDLREEKAPFSLRSSTPLAKMPSAKRPAKTVRYLPWALSADSYAGRPFRTFLLCQDCTAEARLLDLWHDLEEFLPVVLDHSRENSFSLRHFLTEKICESYLVENSIQQLPMETMILQGLQDHLASAEFTPWIYRTQKEICKVLCTYYEKFLAHDDETFLQFMSSQSDVPVPKVQGQDLGKDKYFLLSERINESLKLSQALHDTRNLEGLSPERWRSFGTQDLQKRGMLQVEVEPLVSKTDADSQKMTSKELAVQKESLSVDSCSKDKEVLSPKSPPLAAEPEKKKKRAAPRRKTKSSAKKDTTVAVEKPTRRPRHFVKVLHSPAHLQYFKQFLEERNAAEPLRFWMAMEKLAAETNTKTKNLLVNSIVRNYFHGEIPAEEQLECSSSIIKEISEAETVTPFMLMTAQIFVQKAMEKRWFKEYQDLFPPSDTSKSNLCLRHKMGNFKTDNLRWAWFAIQNIVRSICKFHREMNNNKCRVEFEDFLRKEVENEEENLPMTSTQSNNTLRSHASSARSPRDKDVVLVKRQMFNNQLITVNFLVDDLHFYLEINKFSKLADSAEALAARNVCTKNEVDFLKRKAAIISKLFLSSDIPPRLRVNISEDERDLIWSLSSKGLLNRLLYHRAKVAIFPILIYFWKRFCNWKVMKSFRVYSMEREPTSLTSIKKACSESSEIYSPSNHVVILFSLLRGIQVLLPRSHKKEELEEEHEGSESAETSSSRSTSEPSEQDEEEEEEEEETEGEISQHNSHGDMLQGS